VFPTQGAMLPGENLPKAAAWQDATPFGIFAHIMAALQRFSEVNPAYAQVVPLNVSRIELTVTGPGITDPIRAEINPTTGRTTVNVLVGRDRVFEVQAFPADIPLVNFIGRITADVPSSGANVTVNMQSVTLNSLQVTPTNAQIAKGTVQRFTAMGSFSDGTVQDLTPLVDWASSNSSVAVVSNAEGIEGLASGMQEGSTQITATLLNSTGGTTLTVTAAEVVAITVAPATPSIAIGIRLQFTATGIFTDGTSQDLTMVAGWTSSNPTVATISPTGLATAVAVGSTTISATFQDSTGETMLTVTPVELAAITVAPAAASIAVGTRLQFTATGIFTDGSSLSLTSSVTWTSSRPGVASITNPGGLATAVATGNTSIRATFQGTTGATDLTVRALELAAITVTPAIPTIAIGTRLQFVATGLFTDGTSQDLTNSTVWGSADPAIATISNAANSHGLAVAVAAGSTLISATFQGITGTADLTVTTAQLAAITVSPAIPNIAIGTRLQFTATGIFSDGTSQNLDLSATWTSSNELVATIAPGGLATAVAVGSAVINATFLGVTGSTLLTVTDAVLAAIEVTPSVSSIADGTTLQFVATGLFTDGTEQPLISGVTWMSSDSAVASLSPAGLATAMDPGIATISATFLGVTGSATLTVRDVELAAIVVTPANPTIVLGATMQFTATGFFEDGLTQDLTSSATWQASDSDIASITTTQGLATALALGDTDITATFDGISGTTTLSVADGADLVPVPLSSPPEPEDFCDTVFIGEEERLLVTVQNQGTIDASAFSNLQVVFSPGGPSNVTIPPLAVDASVSIPLTEGLPSGCFESDGCDFTITVDSGNVIPETDEANNIAVGRCSLCCSD
jgi:Big-like domain-containing protein/CARDB protein